MTIVQKPRKPTVASDNHHRAVTNIECKLSFATMLLRMCEKNEKGLADEIRKVLPKSLRAFNQWDAKAIPTGLDLPTASFKSNASETLSGVSSLLKRANLIVASTRALKLQATSTPSKLESMAGLKRQLKFAEVLRGIAEAEAIGYLRTVRQLQEEVANLKNVEATNKREMLLVIEQKNEEVAALRKQISEVAHTAPKVTSLRVARDASKD